MSLEGLYVPTSAPWYAEFKSELLGFPAAKHDDQVDALGLIGKLLDQMVVGQKPKGPEKPKLETGYRRWKPPVSPFDWAAYYVSLDRQPSFDCLSAVPKPPIREMRLQRVKDN
jgi:hypothetical protein